MGREREDWQSTSPRVRNGPWPTISRGSHGSPARICNWNLPATNIALPAKRAALSAAILSDGSIAVIFGDGSVERWDGGTGRSLGSRRLDVSEADQAITDDDYLAISSRVRAGSCCIISVGK